MQSKPQHANFDTLMTLSKRTDSEGSRAFANEVASLKLFSAKAAKRAIQAQAMVDVVTYLADRTRVLGKEEQAYCDEMENAIEKVCYDMLEEATQISRLMVAVAKSKTDAA